MNIYFPQRRFLTHYAPTLQNNTIYIIQSLYPQHSSKFCFFMYG